MIIVGLTGSIGMGKSTTAGMLKTLGIPVHDADAEVHALMSVNGRAEQAVLNAFPALSSPINRQDLGAIIFTNDKKRQTLEAIIHPLVREAQKEFISANKNTSIIVLDIPLLFETGGEARVDKILVVTADATIQKDRVLARPNMTEEKFNAILSRQTSDSEKRSRADFILDTGQGLDDTMEQLKEIIATLKAG